MILQGRKRQGLDNQDEVTKLSVTVEPLLSGHPWGNDKWPLKRGWLLNRVHQKSPQVIKVISVQNYVKRNYEIA